MRKDMYKVIVERPRRGGYVANETLRTDDMDESPRQEGLRKRHRVRKWLNENLRPLERYLAAQVGRPWDKVYAEICAGIDRRNTVQQHIHEHLQEFVATRVVEIDGVLCSNRYAGPEPLGVYWQPRLYIDPRSGVLKVNRQGVKAWRERCRYWKRTNDEPASRRILEPLLQLHRVAGIWYEVELAPVAEAARTQAKPFDALRRLEPAACPDRQDKDGVPSNHTLFGRHDVYAWRKRQLGAGELRRHGLATTTPDNK